MNSHDKVRPPSSQKTGKTSLCSALSLSDEFWKQVLALCRQQNPGYFALEFPSTKFSGSIQYLDSGTFSHVCKSVVVEDDDKHHGNAQKETEVVLKIIKVIQQRHYDLFSKKSLFLAGTEVFKDVYQETMMLQLLSNLHKTVCDSSGHEYQTHAFSRLLCARLVHGPLPNYFFVRNFNDNADEEIKKMYHFEEPGLGLPREHLVTIMKFGGTPILNGLFQIKGDKKIRQLLPPDQVLSVCLQVTMALAVAEAVYQFEHRDLHICNLLVKQTKKSVVSFKLRSTVYTVPSYGVKAIIIDVTYSRLAFGIPNGQIFFSDLSSKMNNLEPSTSDTDRQNVAYKTMYQLVGDKHWGEWHPATNLIWLQYLFEEVLSSGVFRLNEKSILRDESNRTKRILKSLVGMIQKMLKQIGEQKQNHQQKTVSKLVEKILNELDSGLSVEN